MVPFLAWELTYLVVLNIIENNCNYSVVQLHIYKEFSSEGSITSTVTRAPIINYIQLKLLSN